MRDSRANLAPTMPRAPLLLLAATLACAGARPPPPAPTPPPAPSPPAPPGPPAALYLFEGVEVFGARRIPEVDLLEHVTLPLAGTRVDPGSPEFIQPLIASKQALLQAYAPPLLNFSVVTYPKERTLHVTIDLVEAGDAWRMDFTPAPTGTVEDPGGLLARWAEAQQRFWALQAAGKVPEHGVGACRSFVCHGAFDHPELAPLEQAFVDGVPAHFDALVRVLREDADEARRMHAVMLLPYVGDRRRVVQAVLPSVRDPASGVRNEVLRTLGHAQHGEPPGLVPLDVVLDALWFPRATDRNKAGWALVRVLEAEPTPQARVALAPRVLKAAGGALVQMARMRQRIDHEPARRALVALGAPDAGDDAHAWAAWWARARPAGAR